MQGNGLFTRDFNLVTMSIPGLFSLVLLLFSCSASFKAHEIPIPPHPCSGVPMSQIRKEMDENSQQGWCVCNPERVKEKSGKQSCSSNLLLPLALDLGSLAGQEDKSEIQGLPTLFKMIKVIMFSSVTQSCLTLCDPMDCSISVFLFHRQLLRLAQSHVHRVSDAIQQSNPLSFLTPPAFNLSQHQGLFQ